MLRLAGLTSIAAGASVVSGLLLDLAIAARFGAGHSTDAFFVAARIPLGLAAVALVVANQALTPAFVASLERRGLQATTRLVSAVLTVVALGGVLFMALAALLATPLVRLTAPGLDPATTSLAASLVVAMFAVVPLSCGAEVLRALLNARRHYVAPTSMGVVMNGLAAVLVITAGGDIRRVTVAYVAGAAAQLVFMLALAWWHGFRYVPTLRAGDGALAGVGRLSVRPGIGGALNPAARLGEQLVVSFLPVGSVSVLGYGSRLIMAIGGTVFFRSVIVTVIPRLTSASTRGNDREVLRISVATVRLMLAISIPLTAFLAILGQPMVRILFERGSLTRSGAELLGLVLAVYSASLVGSAVQRALLAPFFARLDTRTPLRNTVYGIAANLVLLPLCVLPFGRSATAVVGVAVAYSLAQYVNVGHAWYRLRRVVGDPLQGSGPWALRVVGLSAASAAVMAAAYVLLRLDQQWHRPELMARTAATGAGGLLALGLGALLVAGVGAGGGWQRLLSGRAAVTQTACSREG
jgi:murein biosynthesis integral membrane protein MurJ